MTIVENEEMRYGFDDSNVFLSYAIELSSGKTLFLAGFWCVRFLI